MEQISDSGVDGRRRRRSREQVEELVVEFGSSGLKRSEFCRLKGLALNTLQRHLVWPKRELKAGNGLVKVELKKGEASGDGVINVWLGGSRRIEVTRNFDSETLRRVVRVLEEN
jgi:hypothetical protein